MAKTTSIDIPTNFKEGYGDSVKELITKLNEQKTLYLGSQSISDVAFFELLKRRVFGYTSTLDTYVQTMEAEAERVEDYVKKELRSKILFEYVDGKGDKKKITVTSAERKVEVDPSYIAAKHEMWELKRQCRFLKGRLKAFYTLHSSIVQSVSIAGKEQKDTKLNS